MQGLRRYGLLGDCGGVRLELTPSTTSPLAIDVAESTEMRIQRLISENPVIVFSRSSCCMCHVMKRLLSAIGVHPTVIELEEDEITALTGRNGDEESSSSSAAAVLRGASGSPALYIGGVCVGGLESLVALHLSNNLVPKLVEAGALRNESLIS
jgi:glutaredoxin 3